MTDIYTCPDLKSVTVTVLFTELAGVAGGKVRLSLSHTGKPNTLAQYLLYDMALDANGVTGLSGISLNQTDVLRGWSFNGNVAVNVLVESLQQYLA